MKRGGSPDPPSFYPRPGGEMVDTRDLKDLSARSERSDVECRKFKEALPGKADGNLEPSLQKKEGAETRHDTPKESDSKVKE